MAVKTYVLLESMDSDAPVYKQTVDNKRVQIKKIPVHRPTLRQVFQDKDGINRVIRYKASSRTSYQDEQIDKEKIPANDPFTTTEYRDLEFKHGILVTPKVGAQNYLEIHPECLGFNGFCDDVRQPRYKLLDEVAESKVKNSDMRKRIKAANKVIDLELDAAQAMLIRLNGSFFKTPALLEDCQNLLMNFVDDAEEAGLEAILKEESANTVDENTGVLIGKLINLDVLSFDAVEGTVSKRDRDGKWATLRDLSTELPMEERLRLFSNFLNTEDGKPLKMDLLNDLSSLSDENIPQRPRMGRPPKIQ